MSLFKISCAALLSMICLTLGSQTLTTYYTNFDTPTAQAGWTQYRKASTSANGWAFDPTGYTTSTCLAHYYPVASSAPTEDWYVSPAFNFNAGGKIDSLRTNFSGFSTPQSGDTIAIVLLVGSPNPSQATAQFKLFEFKGSDYVNDGIWKLKTNITIPAKSGQCYIAFKYYTTNSWLDVKYDNLRIKINSTVGIPISKKEEAQVVVFPNPVKDKLMFKFQSSDNLNQQLTLRMYNMLGELILQTKITSGEFINPALENGIHIYQLLDANSNFINTGRIIIQNN